MQYRYAACDRFSVQVVEWGVEFHPDSHFLADFVDLAFRPSVPSVVKVIDFVVSKPGD